MISNYLALQILDYLFGGDDASAALLEPVANQYIALAEGEIVRTHTGTDFPETDYVDYGRVQILNDWDTWEFAVLESGIAVKKNKIAIQFPEVGLTPAFLISHAAVLDAATLGNILVSGTLVNSAGVATPRQFETGDIPRFDAGELIIRIDP